MEPKDKKPSNPTAFPIFLQEGLLHNSHVDAGMNLRDYLAAKVMQGLIQAHSWRDLGVELISGKTIAENIAIHAYKQADAMLKQREL